MSCSLLDCVTVIIAVYTLLRSMPTEVLGLRFTVYIALVLQLCKAFSGHWAKKRHFLRRTLGANWAGPSFRDRVYGSGFRVLGALYRVYGLGIGFMVQVLGFRDI